jgi:hypothetical protein
VPDCNYHAFYKKSRGSIKEIHGMKRAGVPEWIAAP